MRGAVVAIDALHTLAAATTVVSLRLLLAAAANMISNTAAIPIATHIHGIVREVVVVVVVLVCELLCASVVAALPLRGPKTRSPITRRLRAEGPVANSPSIKGRRPGRQ